MSIEQLERTRANIMARFDLLKAINKCSKYRYEELERSVMGRETKHTAKNLNLLEVNREWYTKSATAIENMKLRFPWLR